MKASFPAGGRKAESAPLIPVILVVHRPGGDYFALTTRAKVRPFICSRELTVAEMPKKMKRLCRVSWEFSGKTQEIVEQSAAGRNGKANQRRRHANGSSKGSGTGSVQRGNMVARADRNNRESAVAQTCTRRPGRVRPDRKISPHPPGQTAPPQGGGGAKGFAGTTQWPPLSNQRRPFCCALRRQAQARPARRLASRQPNSSDASRGFAAAPYYHQISYKTLSAAGECRLLTAGGQHLAGKGIAHPVR